MFSGCVFAHFWGHILLIFGPHGDTMCFTGLQIPPILATIGYVWFHCAYTYGSFTRLFMPIYGHMPILAHLLCSVWYMYRPISAMLYPYGLIYAHLVILCVLQVSNNRSFYPFSAICPFWCILPSPGHTPKNTPK